MPTWIAILVFAAASAPADDPSVAFRRALFDFGQGEYRAVVDRLAPLLDPVQLTSEDDVAQGRKTLGTVYFLLGQPVQARAQFELLILMRPDATLDPYATAPPVLRFFAEVRADAEKKGTEMQRVYKQRKDAFEAPRYIERQSIQHNVLLAYLPFGIGQFQNGDIGLGFMFLAFDVIALAVNILGYVALQLTATPQGLVVGKDAGDARRIRNAWYAVQYAGLGSFLAGWIAGAIHARLLFQPVVNVERELAPAGSKPAVTLGLQFGFGF